MDVGILGLFLLVLGSGGAANDLVSWIDADDYFKTRGVEVTAARMREVAARELAVEALAPVNRLLAIRWLGENAEAVKNDRQARRVLERIAAGDRARDPQGFARDYARRALARLDGKPDPVPTVPDDSLRADALAWFPEKAVLVGGFDFRPPPGLDLPADPSLRALLAGSLSDRARKELYALAEVLGNVRVDRISFALMPPPKECKARAFIRITGLLERKRLLDFIRADRPEARVKQEQGPRGELITLISTGPEGPAAALVGDTDLLIAATGFLASGSEQGKLDPVEVLRKALRVRAGR
jgi:hypothetical protein